MIFQALENREISVGFYMSIFMDLSILRNFWHFIVKLQKFVMKKKS